MLQLSYYIINEPPTMEEVVRTVPSADDINALQACKEAGL